MDWSVGEDSRRYTAALNDSDGALRLSSVQHDGMELDSPEISITRDDHHGRLRVEIAGTPRLAYVAKVGRYSRFMSRRGRECARDRHSLCWRR